MSKRYSIEPHGEDGNYVLYDGRSHEFHGYNICTITNLDPTRPEILSLIENALNSHIDDILTSSDPEFLELLDIKDQLIHGDMIVIHNHDNRMTITVNCNDVFVWGSADGEEITKKNFPILKQSIEDFKTHAVDKQDDYDALMLFCARVAKMRPQGACYPKDKNLWKLFDECGPEREVGFGNPYRPGEYVGVAK